MAVEMAPGPASIGMARGATADIGFFNAGSGFLGCLLHPRPLGTQHVEGRRVEEQCSRRFEKSRHGDAKEFKNPFPAIANTMSTPGHNTAGQPGHPDTLLR